MTTTRFNILGMDFIEASPTGQWILYSDHAAEIAAKDALIDELASTMDSVLRKIREGLAFG